MTQARVRVLVVAGLAGAIAIAAPLALADAATPPANTAKPALSGVAMDGQTLTTTSGSWSGTSPFAFTYQWQRCDPVTWACTTVAGASASSYVLTSADVGFKLVSAVTASNGAGQATAKSYGSAVVAPAPPASTAKPALSGVTRDGQALTVSTGSWSGTPPFTYTYQWQRCDPVSWACASIPGATAATYTLTSADVGYKMVAAVTAANAAGQATAKSYGSATVTGTGGGTGSTLYVSPSGSDSGLCTQAAPCLTFEWAYQVASPGSTVLVTCGGASACSYPTQYLRQRYAKPAGSVCRWAETFKDGATAQNLSGCVTFKPAAGVTPTITGGIDISVPYVLIDGLRTGLDPAGGNGGILVGLDNSIGGADCTSLQSHDIILKNTVTNILTVDGAHYLYLVGGSYGPYNDHSSNIEPCLDGAGNHFNTDHVAIDGATFHDYYVVTAGAHDECIHWQDTSQGILRNSRFLNCGQQDVSFQTRNFGYTHLRAFTIENNYFDGACSHQPAPCGVVSGGTTTLICSGSDLTAEDLQDFTIRFNSYASAGAPSFQTYGGCGANITMTGNIVSGPWSTLSCTNDQTAGVTYLDNLFFNNIPCGTGNLLNTNPATTYTNENAYDWTLKTGATAIDAIPPGITYPTTDITGTPRPQHAAPDAGATEYR